MSKIADEHITRTAKRLLGIPGEWGMSQEKMEQVVRQVIDAACFNGARMVITVQANDIPGGEHVYANLSTLSGKWPEPFGPSAGPVNRSRKANARLQVLVDPKPWDTGNAAS